MFFFLLSYNHKVLYFHMSTHCTKLHLIVCSCNRNNDNDNSKYYAFHCIPIPTRTYICFVRLLVGLCIVFFSSSFSIFILQYFLLRFFFVGMINSCFYSLNILLAFKIYAKKTTIFLWTYNNLCTTLESRKMNVGKYFEEFTLPYSFRTLRITFYFIEYALNLLWFAYVDFGKEILFHIRWKKNSKARQVRNELVNENTAPNNYDEKKANTKKPR